MYNSTGNIIDARHAVERGSPIPLCQNRYTNGMIVCVRPPPRLPHPPAVALAVPTTLLLNIIEFQHWFTTEVEPRQDTKKRPMIRPVESLTAALQATTTAPQANKRQSASLGPIFSMTEPIMKRVKTSNDTAAMLAFPIAFLHPFLHTHAFTRSPSGNAMTSSWLSQIPISTRTTVSRGAKANQPMKANVNANVAAQNARM